MIPAESFWVGAVAGIWFSIIVRELGDYVRHRRTSTSKIKTASDLMSLPDGSVILTRAGTYRKRDPYWFQSSELPASSEYLEWSGTLPATVLHSPKYDHDEQ